MALTSKVLVLSFAALFFVTISVVSVTFFVVADDGARNGKRVVSVLAGGGSTYVLWKLATGDADPVAALAAVTLYVYALAMFGAAWLTNRSRPLDFVGSRRAPEHLVQNGPYKFVRHPFYSAYIAAWIASAIGTGDLAVGALATVLALIYWRSAVAEEEFFLGSQLGADYRRYMGRAGRFRPKFRRKSSS